MIQVLSAHHYEKMPWKNRQGFTFQIACSHEDLSYFDWRISIADVKQSGEFSIFKDKQRVLSILEGAGIILHLSHQESHQIQQSELFHFDGSQNIYSELVDGEIRDFNLIYNPQRIEAQIQYLTIQPDFQLEIKAKHTFLFNTAESIHIKNNAINHELKHYDTLYINNELGQMIEFENKQQATCYLIELDEIKNK
nr:HutD family protein [Acinetobacter sp. Marseille-Q1620]